MPHASFAAAIHVDFRCQIEPRVVDDASRGGRVGAPPFPRCGRRSAAARISPPGAANAASTSGAACVFHAKKRRTGVQIHHCTSAG